MPSPRLEGAATPGPELKASGPQEPEAGAPGQHSQRNMDRTYLLGLFKVVLTPYSKSGLGNLCRNGHWLQGGQARTQGGSWSLRNRTSPRPGLNVCKCRVGSAFSNAAQKKLQRTQHRAPWAPAAPIRGSAAGSGTLSSKVPGRFFPGMLRKSGRSAGRWRLRVSKGPLLGSPGLGSQ